MYITDIIELCSSFLFLGIINLINDNQKNKKYHIISIIGLTLASLNYHSMEKLYFKYDLVERYYYEISIYLDNFFIILLSGNLVFNPYISLIISSLTFRYNKVKYLYFVLTYIRTVYYLYRKNRKLEYILLLKVSFLLGYCMFDYKKNGWCLLNSWLWHIGNFLYLIVSTYSEQKILNLKKDIFLPFRNVKLLS